MSSWIEVSRGALAANLATLRARAQGALLAPVIKANAYGHGLELVATMLQELGADWLCVNELAEVNHLRKLPITLPIYVLGPTTERDADEVVALGCHVVAAQRATLAAFADAAERCGAVVPVHLKVETGTHRQGARPEDVADLIAFTSTRPGLRLAGITTHLAAVEDETEHSFTAVQLSRFRRACALAPPGTLRHAAASAAELLLPDATFDLVRPGIAVYGLWPSPETRIAAGLVHQGALTLRPVMRWKTRIVQVTEAEAGAWVGYGRTVRLPRPATLALLPIGYYDGYDRGLSGRGTVLVRGIAVPVLGRVAMNMVVVDVTALPTVAVGDEVTLLGPDHPATTAEAIAEILGTIPYEVTTRLEARIPRLEAP